MASDAGWVWTYNLTGYGITVDDELLAADCLLEAVRCGGLYSPKWWSM